MIYTVTFNPAIDYVVRLDRPLEVGEVNRAAGEDCVLGGKGINVSGVLAQLGCESVALGFVAGETGAWLERGLAAQGLRGLQGSGQCFQLVRRQIAGNQNILRLRGAAADGLSHQAEHLSVRAAIGAALHLIELCILQNFGEPVENSSEIRYTR